jgi:hypothetical protein
VIQLHMHVSVMKSTMCGSVIVVCCCYCCPSIYTLIDMFGMLVHSCFVDDGAGQGKYQLLDDNGCAVDKVHVGMLLLLLYNTCHCIDNSVRFDIQSTG